MAPVGQWALSLALAGAGLGLGGGAAAQAGDESILLGEMARLNNESLLWGPYRPNLYFGVRPRIPKSLTASLLWGRADTYTDIQKHIRYTCEQDEGMAGYGWDEYDARLGGTQTIRDTYNHIDMTTSFIKVPGGAHGGSWGVRVRGEPRADAPARLKTMVVFALTQEEEGATLDVVEDEAGTAWDETGFAGDVAMTGRSSGLGDFRVVVTGGTGEHPTSDHAYSAERDLSKTVVQTLTAPAEHLWQTKALLFRQIKDAVDHVVATHDPTQAPPPWQVYQLGNTPGRGNVQLVQKMFEGAFEFDVLFTSASAGAAALTSGDVTRELRNAREFFDQRFPATFALQAPYDAAAPAANRYAAFARSLFANLLGGVGYFYGHQLVDRSYAAAYDEEDEGFWEEAALARAQHREQLDGPYELYTSVPSRPFFPRGFLWDEGFHLLPIGDWDLDLALDVVRSWFGLMDADGWIAREQILGSEARSKVPPAFQVQYPHYANPPTLFLVVDGFAARLRAAANGSLAAGSRDSMYLENPDAGLAYLRALYPRLRRHYAWFRRTQAGDVRTYERTAFSAREAYRWRGRTEAHVLTSGLDDYPRPQPPHPGELHVDLLSWVGLMARTLANIADLLGTHAAAAAAQGGTGSATEAAEAADYADDLAELRATQTAIARNLEDLHWSEADGCFCDATVDAYEENELVCHHGYISLFPLLTGLLAPDDPKVGPLLRLLGDENELFSPHGLRSLSRRSPLYGTAENYWRSPVWININYLAVVELARLGSLSGPFRAQAADLHNRLRRNLVDTVYASWLETGFAWEQYNPETGQGQRTQHFTGWTSLIVKIMAMPELDVETEHVRDEL